MGGLWIWLVLLFFCLMSVSAKETLTDSGASGLFGWLIVLLLFFFSLFSEGILVPLCEIFWIMDVRK